MTAIHRLIPVAGVAFFGYLVGWAVPSVRHAMPQQVNYPFLAEPIPMPYHVPEHPGGLSFRFAMAHDVLMERFAKHGPAFYRERDRLTRQGRDKLPPGEPAWFEASDDLAAGVERLGRSDEAVAIMRDKLAGQRGRGIAGRELYTTFANLGTFLIHGSFRASMAGDPGARERFREGVEFIRRSVEVNPQAHFGRERWQAAIAEFLLAAMDDPKLLTTFDCLGNRLDLPFDNVRGMKSPWPGMGKGYGLPHDGDFGDWFQGAQAPMFHQEGVDLDDPAIWSGASPIRQHITRVGAEQGWDAVPVPSHRKPAPFDEPALGIIGMWRQGGGANPHFALAIGETMLRVGQRYLAWEAFERASRMADRFWPGQAEQQALREHCQKRQAGIEEALKVTSRETRPPKVYETAADLRSRFDAELAFGEEYQKTYQEYESGKIEGGFSIDDEHFFDAFLASRPPIATEPGPEEWFVRVPESKRSKYEASRARAWGVFGAGLAAMVAVLLIRRG